MLQFYWTTIAEDKAASYTEQRIIAGRRYYYLREWMNMESGILYKVQKDDLPKMGMLLHKCFASDPLYQKLIPDEKIRMKLMPKLFSCDVRELYENCRIYADSSRMQGILVVSDEAEPYNVWKYYLKELQAQLQTDGYLIREDPSLKTLFNFFVGRDYLNAHWTEKLHRKNRIHIIYLAVDEKVQHHGIAAMLLEEVIRYADANGMMISLETHNDKNVAFYEKHGFQVYSVIEKCFNLKQYCLIRESRQ